MGGVFGKIALNGPRSSYRLNFHHTAKVVDHRLALRRRDRPGDRSDRGRAERGGDGGQDIAEEREDHDLAAVFGRLPGDV